MPRIIVTTDPPEQSQPSVLLDELVHSVHLSTGHAAAQLVERLAWAISDAEEAERIRADRLQAQRPTKPGPEPATSHRAPQAIAA
ncbi:MAG TPA: hypothetical protein VNZ01_06360 [Solirubrobacteraceae bacterium]|nr:hypothetical protein [Solirubrobacteraceae bacterium]